MIALSLASLAQPGWRRAIRSFSSARGRRVSGDGGLTSGSVTGTRSGLAVVLPRVDGLDAGVAEVLDVSGGEACAVDSAYGGNLGVEAVDGVAGALTVRHDVGVHPCRRGIEGQDLLGKGAEHLVSCPPEVVLTATVRHSGSGGGTGETGQPRGWHRAPNPNAGRSP